MKDGRLLGLALLGFAAFATPLSANTGGPDASGYSWVDQDDGCDRPWDALSGAEQVWPLPGGPIGPIPLGFTAPFHGEPVREVWISSLGYVTFDAASAVVDHPPGQLMPDPALPNHVLAPFWVATSADEVRAESLDGVFRVRWTFDSLLDLSRGATCDLFFFRDGRFSLRWSHERDTRLATVGHEGAGGLAGTTWHREGASLDPGFPAPGSGRSACVTPGPDLDCSAPLAVTCGVTNGTLPPAAAAGATVYGCESAPHRGAERVVELDVARPRRVTFEVQPPHLGLLHLAPGSCDASACRAHGTGLLAHPVLFAGRQRHVVDRPDPGGGDAFELTVTCEDLPTLTCATPVLAERIGADTMPTHGLGLELDGPEVGFAVTTGAGVLGVTLDPPDALWAIAYDPSGEVLRSGRGGVSLAGLSVGEVVVVVDGPAASAGAFTATLSCSGTLDCPPDVTATCGDVLVGDTRGGASSSDFHPCVAGALTGAEAVHRIAVPAGQVVTAHLVGGNPRQRVLLLEGCDEERCVSGGATSASCSSLPAGEYLIVVDSPAGFEGPYEVRLQCEDVGDSPPRLLSVEALGTWAGCDVGPSAGVVRVQVENPGSGALPAPFELVAFEDADASGSFSAGDRELGRTLLADDLLPRELRLVEFAIAAPSHRDALVHAEILPGGSVVSTAACLPGSPPLELAIEWARPDASEWLSITTPSVADLDGDGLPEVVFQVERGPRAVSGVDGSEHWTNADGRADAWLGQPALVDLTRDGLPEAVYRTREFRAPDVLRSRLVAVDGDGRLLWRTEPLVSELALSSLVSGPSVGDVDGDGRPELAWAADVVDSEGRRAWTPQPAGLAFPTPSLLGSVFGDLNGDGRPELVTGSVARRLDPDGVARVEWTFDDVPHGFPAVVDLDADGAAEVVLVRDGIVRVLEGLTGAPRWERPLASADGCGDAGHGGTPTIADLDGDGELEIGVAGRERYTVFRRDGQLFWTAPLVDCSSAFAAAAAFDFEDDGRPELVIRDEVALRILDGSTGALRASMPMESATTDDMPLVADVDGDGVAEILTTSAPVPGLHPGGLLAVGPAGESWAGGRRVWNERSYRAGHASEDGEVTAAGACGPSPSEGVRLQRSAPLRRTFLPDVTLFLVEPPELVAVEGCEALVRVRARVGNGGAAGTGGGVDVTFYLGDPSADVVLEVLGTPDLRPSSFVDLETTLRLPRVPGLRVTAVADDDGTGGGAGGGRIVECREDNNACGAVAPTDPLPRPDDVGAVLRATGHGSPLAAFIEADWSWAGDLGSPRDPGDSYFIRRSTGPQLLARVPGTEGHRETTWSDATPATGRADLPGVHYYRVSAEDACGNLSDD